MNKYTMARKRRETRNTVLLISAFVVAMPVILAIAFGMGKVLFQMSQGGM